MNYTYHPKGVCSRKIDFSINENGIVTDVHFIGGCDGNLKGICALSVGQSASELVKRLRGITCGPKSTSCPDQLATALEKALNEAQHAG